MLTGKELWNLMEHIIPVYVIVLSGWGLFRFKFILPVHAPGINRFVSLVAIPAYAFHLLAFNDPYKIDLRLVGADILQKFVALTLGICYWAFAKNGKLEHVINFFMLATLPNTVLIGDALLDPLYGDAIHGKVVTIIFLQAILWYNLAISLYEMRLVLKELQDKADAEDAEAKLEWQLQQEQRLGISKTPHAVVVVENGGQEKNGMEDGHDYDFANMSAAAVLDRTLSAPARVSFSLSKVVPMVVRHPSVSKVDEGTSMEDFPAPQDSEAGRESRPYDPFSLISDELLRGGETREAGGKDEQAFRRTEGFRSGMVEVGDPAEQPQRPERRRVNMVVFSSMVAYKVFNRLKYVPLTFSSVIGFAYSLFAYKWHWQMPYYVQTSVELISNSAVGLALFILGMTWAVSGKLVACGWKTMTRGMFIRFIVGPFIMIVTALAFRLKGDNYRFAVVQAVIPQGVISFVLAKEYNLSVNEFSTAVVFQLIVFIPVVIVYYLVLGAV